MGQFRERQQAARPAVKAADCPCVAELIDFAEGRAGTSDRQRIEAHLADTGCGYCQSWISKAGAGVASPFSPQSLSANPSAKSDPATWRQQAFLDLEQRLKQIEDGGKSPG